MKAWSCLIAVLSLLMALEAGADPSQGSGPGSGSASGSASAAGAGGKATGLPGAASPTSLPSDAEMEESWARVLVRANPGPFQYVAYELTDRGAAGVASHVRGVMGRRDVWTQTELVPRETLRKTFAQLRDLGALDLPQLPIPGKEDKKVKKPAKAKGGKAPLPEPEDPLAGPQVSDVPIYELSFRLGGKERTILVPEPYAQADRRYAEYIQTVRALVVSVARDIGYLAPTGRAGEEGYLFIDSVPSATVTVDGQKLPEPTPILALTIAPGSHTIVLENERLQLRREYKVKVQPGLTTSLEVDLR